jgi:multiple sugar transport system permease protein
LKTVGIELAEKGGEAAASVGRKRSRRLAWKDYAWAYLMIAPLMIGLLIFYIWPVFQTFYFSFTTWGAFGKYHWSGLDNYQQLFHDPDLVGALTNTLIYTVLSVPGSIIISILVAVLLNQKMRGVGVYRTLFFLPAVTMPAAIAVVWRWLYNGDYGLINYLLSLVHIHGPRWISDTHIALYSLILVSIWNSVGTNMVLFLAGLQSIPSMYYEAASLDGSGRFSTFFRITLPLLSPTIFFQSVVASINAFQMFDLIFLMFSPAATGTTSSVVINSTQTVVYLFYDNAFILDNKGYAAAIAAVLFVVILVVTLVQFQMQKRWVHYS